jgi:hypothetical protein
VLGCFCLAVCFLFSFPSNIIYGKAFAVPLKKIELEMPSEYLRDDRLMIQCDITVVTGLPVSQAEPMSSK